jgi:hypothetical protein
MGTAESSLIVLTMVPGTQIGTQRYRQAGNHFSVACYLGQPVSVHFAKIYSQTLPAALFANSRALAFVKSDS